MKRSFFQAATVSILLYGCTTYTLTKRMEKKLDGNYIRMLRAILNKSCRQHPTKQQLYGHIPTITKTLKVRRTGHAGYCWRSRDELISDVLLWTPSHGRVKAGRPARTYIQQHCTDAGCCLENPLPSTWERWTIMGGVRGPGRSVLMTRQDDDDDVAILKMLDSCGIPHVGVPQASSYEPSPTKQVLPLVTPLWDLAMNVHPPGTNTKWSCLVASRMVR